MFRYLAIVWDTRSEQSQAYARCLQGRIKELAGRWQTAIERPGLQVHYAGARAQSIWPTMLPNGEGVVLGTLFERNQPPSKLRDSARLAPSEGAAIISSAGGHLINNYWGRYVAFVTSPDGSNAWILRDPAAGLPCYFATIQGVLLFFSWTEDALAVGLENCSVNWHYVSRFVCCGDPQTRATGIQQIQEVHGGERLQLQWGHLAANKQLWDATHIAHSDLVEDIQEAVHAVRSTTEHVTWAWASCYSHVVHLLSGGLDSSILLRCLQSAPARPGITCLNYFGAAAADEDERALARLAMNGVDCELIERAEQGGNVRLERMLDCARTAVPLGMLYRAATQDGERELARRLGSSAYFSGVGGDAVFYQGPVALALADHLRRHWGSCGFFDFALAIAHMEDVSLASILARACRSLLPGVQDRVVQSMRHRTVVNADVLREAAREPEFFWHRWPAAHGELGPAKLRHLYYMRGNGIHFYSPFGAAGDPEYVCPLLSQPLLEVCLRIPVYLHTAAGWDRAIERRAFSGVVHPNIILRRRKGAAGAEMRTMLQTNLPFVRELMLDGLLVREQLLDRRKVEQALHGANVRLSPAAGEILGDHLSLEAWLQRWTRSGAARATMDL